MLKYFRKTRQSGYTLMEMVVAVGIFIIITTAIMGVFIAILRMQRKTVAMQAVQQDARWAMETMARYARMDKVSYCENLDDENCHIPAIYYPDVQADFDEAEKLYLEDTIFKKEGTKLTINGNDITPTRVEVLDLKFYIAPGSILKPFPQIGYISPYESDGPDEQSRITILMKTKSVDGKEEEEMTLQTTVSTRAYTR